MKLTYIGPHAAVEVPHDDVPGGEIVVEHGETVDLPAELAKGLLEQGRDSAEDNPQHQPQWKRVSEKKKTPAQKSSAAAAANDETASTAGEGDA